MDWHFAGRCLRINVELCRHPYQLIYSLMADFFNLIDRLLPMLGFAFGAAGALASAWGFYAQRYAEAQKKSYAAQRDFELLHGNYQKLSAEIETLARDLDQGLNRLADLIRQQQQR